MILGIAADHTNYLVHCFEILKFLYAISDCQDRRRNFRVFNNLMLSTSPNQPEDWTFEQIKYFRPLNGTFNVDETERNCSRKQGWIGWVDEYFEEYGKLQ